jgi:hypothetical protein
METAPRLHLDSQIRCLHCHRWHAVILRHAEGTDYTRAMLYWQCRGRDFYAGQVGGPSRYPARRPRPAPQPALDMDCACAQVGSPRVSHRWPHALSRSRKKALEAHQSMLPYMV